MSEFLRRIGERLRAWWLTSPLGPPWSRATRVWASISAVLALVLLGVMVTILVFIVSNRAAPPTPPRAVAEPTRPDPAPKARPGESGVLRIDARPWGEIVSLTDSTGRRPALPPLAYTPLLLELPAGSYRVVLSHPKGAAPVACVVEVSASEGAQCLAEFFPITADRFFQESGWWR